MAFNFKYSCQVLKHKKKDYELKFVINNSYFNDKEKSIKNFIETNFKNIINDYHVFPLDGNINTVDDFNDYLKKYDMEIIESTKSYFDVIRFYIISEFKSFNLSWKLVNKKYYSNKYNDIVSKYYSSIKDSILNDLIKKYIETLKIGFDKYIDFNKYNKTNIQQLHHDLLIKLNENTSDFVGLSFTIKKKDINKKILNNVIYYHYADKISKRRLSPFNRKKKTDVEKKKMNFNHKKYYGVHKNKQ